MFGFFKRKKKQESDQQDALESQTVEAEGQESEEEAAAREAVHEHDPETQQTTTYRPDEVEREAAREALDDDGLIPGDAQSALGEVPLETPRETLAHEAPRPDEMEPAPSAPAAEPGQETKVEVLAQAADEAQEEVREQAGSETPDDMPPPAEPEAGAPKAPAQDKPRAEKKGWFARIRAGLGKTRANLTDGLADLFLGKKQIDDELMEDLETQLLMADVGVEATTEIIDNLSARVSRKELKDPEALYRALQDELTELLAPVAKPLALPPKGKGPFVILVVGVNGVGKTTTIGKLTKRFQADGRSVMLAAGDTFRAAAVEQLKVWGERNQVPVVAQHTGADSASVIYDALAAAKARGVDVLIADTAGRLHNKRHLMEELKKVRRVMAKLDETAPQEVMLVLDAGTGQNALSQASTFDEAIPVTGITLTKLDGTAKGGIIFALAKQRQTPIRFIGVGETLDDLRPFAADEFVGALFSRDGESAG
ncbi:signal recognition particle-docking protein FtsY [Modicisalibacter ilicicola DSM 19980]|uniref:Signal recognition particle receptor FtsY n=1 Tax=Modicisalibacter ilicicola DSM 19980 TaxID=1121942 RepID=A0A1M4V9K8_9GAMM|nr:signal recognition particle-docking protein FtsY [Halomonas ilicicola]SHE65570.1 signal recognition particle-docking protein FtsY [Halomonas ilicicola DSM 19980]